MSNFFLLKFQKLKLTEKIFTIFFSSILIGCSFNKQKSPAPIVKNEAKTTTNKERLNYKTKKPPATQETALSLIWSKKGKLLPKTFSELSGWADEDFSDVWQAWEKNCDVMSKKKLLFKKICKKSKKINFSSQEEIKLFFEKNFNPYQIDFSPNTITGYYEPILKGSLKRSKRFSYPLYKKPDDLIIKRITKNGQPTEKWFHGKKIKTKNGLKIIPYPSRKELSSSNSLKGFEIVYLDNAIDAFFLQIQGSGRIELQDKSSIRLGYSASNGHPYRSIGSWLIKNNELSASSASMKGIKNWLKKNPSRQSELLNQNPRIIFFQDLTKKIKINDGPIGSLGVPLTAGRSIAVDTNYVSLGLPVFLSTVIPKSKTILKKISSGNRLVFAQDTGKAIRGPNRGDLYFGSGKDAGNQAGRMKYPGIMTIFVPN